MSNVPTRSEQNTSAWYFLAPALLLIGVFFFLPVGASLLLSITDFDIYAIADRANTRFVGLRNYTELFNNSVFWAAVKNTFYFALVGGPLTVAASLAAALLVVVKRVYVQDVLGDDAVDDDEKAPLPGVPEERRAS